jgi:hypothetical protein
MNDELEKNLKGNGSVLIEALSRLLLLETKENHETPQSG